jgi:hypothetical protein
MKAKSFLPILFLSAFVVACDEKIETPNGEVPENMLQLAKSYEGTFIGQVERQANEMKIEFQGNKPVLTLAEDMVAPACRSSIGQLLSVTVSKKDDQMKLESAQFAFDPNLCGNEFEGRRLYLYFKDGNTFDTSILDRVEYRTECEIGTPPQYPNPTPPGYNCRREAYAIYLSGRFAR